MFFAWNRWIWIPGSQFVYFVCLLLLSYLIFNLFFRFTTPKIASGLIILALGIFTLTCLPIYNLAMLTNIIIAMELLIIWLFLATMLLQSDLNDGIDLIPFGNRMGIGAWVAGTVVTTLMLDQAESTMLGFIILLAIMALILGSIYLVIILKWLITCLRKKFRIFANGMVLLGTIAIQSIALLLSALFHEDIASWVYGTLIFFGIFFYFIGLFALIHHLFTAHRSRFIAYWPNVNCFCYGAMAITGFTMLNTEIFSHATIIIVFIWTAVCFLIVEGIEICRLVLKVKSQGIKKAICVYDTSQWARVFSIAMFYAFTRAFYHQHSIKHVLVVVIANYGHYVVTALLVFELVLCLKQLSKNPKR